MDPQEFARHLACWMPPGVLARAASDWADRAAGHEVVSLRFESPTLTHAAEGRFDWFVRQFLNHAIVPEELIRFTQGTYASHVTPESADWLRTFKFTGDARVDPDHPPDIPGRTVLMAISAPLCEARVIWPPIQMINELVSVKVAYWRRVARVARPEQVHHEPVGEWPFEAWFDLQIARALGFPAIGRAAVVSPIHRISNLRGHVSVAGPLPGSAAELSALSFAASLQPQLRSRSYELDQEVRKA